MAEKKRRTRAPVKGRYKVRVIAQPLPTISTMTAPMNPIPGPTVATSTASTQMSMVKSAASTILVTVCNLAQGNFEGIPCPTGRTQVEEHPTPPTAVHPNLKLYPLSQPFRSEKTPLGLTPYQPPWIYSKPGQMAKPPYANTHSESRESRGSAQSSYNPPCYGFTETNEQ